MFNALTNLPKKFAGATGRFVAKQHNKIQFVGYEVANIVLALQKGWGNYGVNYETAAAGSFIIGSGLIWGFDFDKRPTRLLYGGLGLTAGGVCLALAGYEVAGVAVAIASLETARGGLNALKGHIEALGDKVKLRNKLSYQFLNGALKPYTALVDAFTKSTGAVGKFINDRPFVTGTLIKVPGRLEFIGKKALEGDWIGVGVGTSWLVLGDGALTLNDSKLKDWIENKSKEPEADSPSPTPQ